jgi:hypothetical protein|nr:MAG TPA: hypothetical protein [Caudoviricetes sp.]
MSFQDVHNKAIMASLDCVMDELLDALNDADQCGAWDVPAHRRDADQDEAVIRVQESQAAAGEYMQLFIADRYGFDSTVQLETGVL